MAEGHVNDTASADSPIRQNKWGITRGIANGKKLKPGEKFTVVVPEELLRVVGHDAQAFITEASIIVRNYAPLQVTDWKKIEQHEKEKLWGWLQATGEMKDQVDLWHETHFSGKKKDWVDERSKELYDQMLELRGKSKEDGVSPMTDKEICLEVLKKKSGYVRSLGPGPKPSSISRSKTSNVELEEARRRADEAESQARKLSEEVAMLKANQAEMVAKQEEMNRQNEETQALVRMMIGQLRSRGITRYSSSDDE